MKSFKFTNFCHLETILPAGIQLSKNGLNMWRTPNEPQKRILMTASSKPRTQRFDNMHFVAKAYNSRIARFIV